MLSERDLFSALTLILCVFAPWQKKERAIMAGSALSQGGCGYAKSSRAQIRSSRGLRHGGCRRPVLESSWRPIRRPAVSMYAPSKRISGTATGDLIQGWLRGAVNKVRKVHFFLWRENGCRDAEHGKKMYVCLSFSLEL